MNDLPVGETPGWTNPFWFNLELGHSSNWNIAGKFDDEARLLFDTREGRVTDNENIFRATKDVADGTLWAVVHDNRGGATWIIVPLHVR